MNRMKITLHPEVDLLSEALFDFIVKFSWQRILVLYQKNEGTSETYTNFIYAACGNRLLNLWVSLTCDKCVRCLFNYIY